MLDHTIAQAANGGNNALLDAWAVIMTDTLTWVPLFVCLLVLVVKNNEPRQVALVMGSVAVTLLLSAGLPDLVVKPLVMRPRPVDTPELQGLVHAVRGYRAAGFSFFSAHASNTMALTVFMALLVRNRAFTVAMLTWTVLNCWTRLYLGCHFASDILAGLAWGAVAGLGVFHLFYRPLYRRISTRLHFISSQYTRMGYAYADIDTALAVLALTLAVTLTVAAATAL